jgi:putative ABC transport system ATP-binding protein
MNRDTSLPLLRTRNLERRYDVGAGHVHVLRQISLDVEAGDFVTIMGPSGAGKTTLLSILGMLDHEWGGEFWLAGEPVHQLKPKQRMALSRTHIGFVFQQYHLLDDLTVAENLEVPLSYRDVPRTERQALVAETLDRFALVGRKDLFPSQLSGGQQQLVGVARAIIARPAIILADEPTGSLHSKQGREIMELFHQLNAGGTTIIQVTHNEEWAGYGSRTLELQDGWVVKDSRPAATAVAPDRRAGGPTGAGLLLPILLAATALAAALPGNAAAASSATDVRGSAADTLHLDAAVRMALAGSPELRIAAARADMAGADRTEAWGRFLPSLGVSAGVLGRGVLQRTVTDPVTGGIIALPDSVIELRRTYSTGASVDLSWTVLESGQRVWGVRRSRAEMSAARFAVEAARARVAAGVTLAYLDVLEAEAQRRVRDAEVTRAAALADAAQARLEIGEAPEIDALQARLAASDAELALHEADAAAESARLALLEFLGPGIPADMHLAMPPAAPAARLPEEEIRRCALLHSADLASLRARSVAAGRAAAATNWSVLPTIRVGMELSRSEFGLSRQALTLEPRNEETRYRMTLSWAPLDQPGRWAANRQRAQAAGAEAEAQLAARRPAVTRDVDVALGRLRRARILEERSELNLELAARQREQADERYRLGLAPITETLQAEALSREAERQAVTAQFARRRALAELERAASIRLDDPAGPCGGPAGSY